MKRTRRILTRVLVVLVVVLLLATGGGIWFIRSPWPQTSGTIAIPGLAASVQVIRDKWGVPHIYAQNEHDLFMAQGYVHAQDRLWQMYFDHLTTKGLLSSVIGSPGLATDRFLRTIGLYRAAEQEWAHE
nr:penicillin acylase family protein [Herpetosiphonaceae bacterium]